MQIGSMDEIRRPFRHDRETDRTREWQRRDASSNSEPAPWRATRTGRSKHRPQPTRGFYQSPGPGRGCFF